MSWTDVLSPAIVSQGPAQCALRPSFTGVFYATMLAPVLACTCAVCLLMAGIMFRPRKGLTADAECNRALARSAAPTPSAFCIVGSVPTCLHAHSVRLLECLPLHVLRLRA
jgi:hypothetical protein